MNNILANALPLVNGVNANKHAVLIISKSSLVDGIVTKVDERHEVIGQFQFDPTERRDEVFSRADIYLNAWLFDLNVSLINSAKSKDVGAVYIDLEGKRYKCYNLTNWDNNGWVALKGGLIGDAKPLIQARSD